MRNMYNKPENQMKNLNAERLEEFLWLSQLMDPNLQCTLKSAETM